MLSLEGKIFLDMAHQYPGPYCSMLLGDLGADVVKIERPDGGDPARHLPGFFRSINRNKRSMTLNLKIPAAREVLYRLVEQADIFTEGFRPGVAKRLEIDYQTLGAINPRLIYCSISGYGQDGPYRDLPGHDLSYMGMAGVLECLKDNEGNPIAPGIAIGDLSSGMFAAIGILTTLLAREKTGRGQYVDVSMFDGLVSLMGTRLGLFFDTGSSERVMDAGYGIFKAEDGKHFTLSIAHEDWFWDQLCSAIGIEEYKGLSGMERRERRDELVAKLRSVFSKRSLDEWMGILQKADVPSSPIHGFREVSEDPHIRFRRMIEEVELSPGKRIQQVGFPIKLSETPATMRLPSPELGAHTEEVLVQFGYSQAEIEDLVKSGVV